MASKPKSAEMVPGPGFRIRMNFERPPKELVDQYRQFETPDISDMLNRMYTMSADIHNLVNYSRAGRTRLHRQGVSG